MTLGTIMTTVTPRERSGSQTAARYDFQANYAILKLIELRETRPDFQVIFDYYDDLVVLDSASNPQGVSFYQLKSKDPGDWTIKDLCKKVGAKSPRSIVARLYSHVTSFGDAIVETALISNAPFKIKLNDGTTTSAPHTRITGSELHTDEITVVETAVNDDITPANVPPWLPKLAFIRTSLGVHEQELVVIGRLQQHLEQEDADGNPKTTALYRTLHASVIERSKFSEEGLPFDQLLSRKSLTKTEVDALISRAQERGRSYIEDWPLISADLTTAGVGSKEQIQIRSAAIAYARDRSAGRPSAARLALFAGDWTSNNQNQIANSATVLEIANLMQNAATESFHCSNLELRAAFLVEAHGAANGAD
jgi:hypothetical protein